MNLEQLHSCSDTYSEMQFGIQDIQDNVLHVHILIGLLLFLLVDIDMIDSRILENSIIIAMGQ